MPRQLNLDPTFGPQLIRLRDRIVEQDADWNEIGLMTGSTDVINRHPRLLRSKRFGDDDYPDCVLDVLITIATRDIFNIPQIEQLLGEDEDEAEFASSADSGGRRIVFTPSVFQVPKDEIDRSLVAVMMPFGAAMQPVYEAIQGAVTDVPSASLTCLRADNMWEHSTVIQDIFSLIFRSFIVVCDFTGRNPNVFYEAGIAHTLGKHVVPITQSSDDMPFDLRHHRYLHYLGNSEGLATLRTRLSARLRTLVEQQP